MSPIPPHPALSPEERVLWPVAGNVEALRFVALFPNPAGLADGSRWSFGAKGANDHRNASRAYAPRRGARPFAPGELGLGNWRCWHPCRGAACGRVVPVVGPLCPCRPPATICQPSGLGRRGHSCPQPRPHTDKPRICSPSRRATLVRTEMSALRVFAPWLFTSLAQTGFCGPSGGRPHLQSPALGRK